MDNNNNQYDNYTQQPKMQYNQNNQSNQQYGQNFSNYNQQINDSLKKATNFMGGTFTTIQKNMLVVKIIINVLFNIAISVSINYYVSNQPYIYGISSFLAIVVFVMLMLRLYDKIGKEARELDVQISTIEAAKSLKNIEFMLQQRK